MDRFGGFARRVSNENRGASGLGHLFVVGVRAPGLAG
jgi:hypothetical protein